LGDSGIQGFRDSGIGGFVEIGRDSRTGLLAKISAIIPGAFCFPLLSLLSENLRSPLLVGYPDTTNITNNTLPVSKVDTESKL